MSESHWDAVFSAKDPSELSWYQADPQPSLRLLSGCRSVIDVGAGRSALASRLLDEGVDLTVLDISPASLALTASELGPRAASVHFIAADVTAWRPERTWEGWHDRAVFHFLTQAPEQERYAATVYEALTPGGRFVLGCFASDGPEKCSGLPTARHDADDLVRIFADLELVDTFRQEHRTPWQTAQMFTWAVFTRP